MVRRHGGAGRLSRRQLAAAGVPVLLAVIAFLTLTPDPAQADRAASTPWSCLLCGETGTADVILNILLFVPLGVALRAAGLRFRSAALAALAISLTVELLQATLIAGRDASLSDVLANSVGAALGASLSPIIPAILLPPPFLARRLAVAGIATIALAWGGAWWALGPAPAAGPYHISWQPVPQFYVPFRGSILSARAGAEALRAGPLPAAFADSYRRQRATLQVQLASGGPVTAMATILDVDDARQRPVISLTQLHSDLYFSTRMNADRVRLRSPAIRLPHGMPNARGDTAVISATMAGRTLELRATSAGGPGGEPVALTSRRDFSPLLGWMLVLPFDPDEPLGHMTSAAWIGLPLLLVMYWLARSRVGGRRSRREETSRV